MSRARTDQAERDVESALASLDAEALRELLRELLPELDQRARNRAENLILQRAAHNGTGWVPAAVKTRNVPREPDTIFSATCHQTPQAQLVLREGEIRRITVLPYGVRCLPKARHRAYEHGRRLALATLAVIRCASLPKPLRVRSRANGRLGGFMFDR